MKLLVEIHFGIVGKNPLRNAQEANCMGDILRRISSFLDLDRVTCKDAHLCGEYSPSSYTCVHGGGNYCGKYRALKKNDPQKASTEESVDVVVAEPMCVET